MYATYRKMSFMFHDFASGLPFAKVNNATKIEDAVTRVSLLSECRGVPE